MKLIKLGNKLKLIKPDSCYYMGGVNVLPPPATVIEYFFFGPCFYFWNCEKKYYPNYQSKYNCTKNGAKYCF